MIAFVCGKGLMVTRGGDDSGEIALFEQKQDPGHRTGKEDLENASPSTSSPGLSKAGSLQAVAGQSREWGIG